MSATQRALARAICIVCFILAVVAIAFLLNPIRGYDGAVCLPPHGKPLVDIKWKRLADLDEGEV